MAKMFIEFNVKDGKEQMFREALERFDKEVVFDLTEGWRADEQFLRGVLGEFANHMEAKLRKNDHKTDWKTLPVEALFRRLLLEIEEYKVAHEFLPTDEARKELVDIANFALIVWDRLRVLDQNKPAKGQ